MLDVLVDKQPTYRALGEPHRFCPVPRVEARDRRTAMDAKDHRASFKIREYALVDCRGRAGAALFRRAARGVRGKSQLRRCL